jgi:H+/Na+-translocating ferredoxin:NAD+ oxidoreductase subunit E
MSELRQALYRGVWAQNPALIQLLGLCPLLAVTTTLVNGLVLGIATLLVLLATNTLVSGLRWAIVPAVRIPLFVLIIASFVTTVDLLLNAVFNEIYQVLGLFIPLIVTNCAILAQAETVASRKGVGTAVVSAFATGLGFTLVLGLLGALRELLGQGTLLAGLDLVLGDSASRLELALPIDGALVAVLPPGAFFGLAALLAARNFLASRRRRSTAAMEVRNDA